jgi:hypothetical protein
MPSIGRRNPKEIQPKGVCQAPLPYIKERLSISPSIKNSVKRYINLMQSDLSLTSPYIACRLYGVAKKRIVRIKRSVSVVGIVIERIALRLLHHFVGIIVVNICDLCSPVVGFSLDDRRSYCCLPSLTIL